MNRKDSRQRPRFLYRLSSHTAGTATLWLLPKSVRDAAITSECCAKAESRVGCTTSRRRSARRWGAFLSRVLGGGQYPRFLAAITDSDRLDAKEEMQVSVELILDGAAARIEAARARDSAEHEG